MLIANDSVLSQAGRGKRGKFDYKAAAVGLFFLYQRIKDSVCYVVHYLASPPAKLHQQQGAVRGSKCWVEIW